MIKYKASVFGNIIKQVEILRETQGSVFFKRVPFDARATRRKERREAKLFANGGYFDTWTEAHEFLSERAQVKMKAAIRNADLATASYERIKGMSE